MAEEVPGRPMKFPYTFSAKIAQFPLKFHIQNQWVWKYWVAGIVLSFPIFYKIHKLCKNFIKSFYFVQNMIKIPFFQTANSPENVAKWAEIHRKEAAEHH